MKRFRWRTIRLKVLFYFINLFLLTVLTITGFAYYKNRQTILTLANDLISNTADNVIEKTINYLQPSALMSELSSRLAATGGIDLTNNQAFEQFAIEIIRTYPQLAMFNVGDEQGNFLMPKKLPDGTIATKVINRTHEPQGVTWRYRNQQGEVIKEEFSRDIQYDPRVRPWYLGAKSTQNTYWSNLYILFTDKVPGITAAHPVKLPNGKLFGVFGLDIELGAISKFLETLKVGEQGIVFIINQGDEIVAYPDMNMIFKSNDDKFRLTQLQETGKDWLVEGVKRYRADAEENLIFEYKGVKYISAFKPFPPEFGKDWLIGIVVPLDDFIGEINQVTQITLLFSMVILVMGIILVTIGSHRLTRPITMLVEATKLISNGQWDLHLDTMNKDDKEIRELAQSFNTMSHKLKQSFNHIEKQNKVLQEQEERYRTLVTNVNVGIYRVQASENARLLHANPAFLRIFGFQQLEHLVDVSVVNLFEAHQAGSQMLELLQTETDGQTVETSLIKTDGQPIWVACNAKAQRDSQGQALWLDGYVYDITEKKNAEELLADYNRRLESTVAERTKRLQEMLSELEQQNTQLSASNRKLEELSQTKDLLLKKLSDLQDNQVSSLKHQLTQLIQHKPSDHKDTLRLMQACLTQIDDTLRPVSKLYQSEQAIFSKKVLLAEPNRKQQILAGMALLGTGVDLKVVATLEEGREVLSREAFDILCVSVEMLELALIAKDHAPTVITVLITSSEPSQYLPFLREYPVLSNIVSRTEDDRTFTLKNIITTVSKLMTDDLFGMEKYLNWGVEINQLSVTHSHQRDQLIETMSEHFQNLGVRNKYIDQISLIAEEMLMNAIYDAPTDLHGKAKYNHLSRKVAVELKESEHAKMRFACDGMLLAVSVEDPFGALSKETMLDYLESCYEGRAGTLDREKGGAGRGLFLMLETSDLFVVNVKPGVRTEVIAFINIEPAKQRRTKISSMHYFNG